LDCRIKELIAMPWTRSEISQLHELARLESQLDALEHDIRQAHAAAREAAAASLDFHIAPAVPRARVAGERVRLDDRTEIFIRSIEPADAAQLELEFEHLGALSRARGLLPTVAHLSDAQLQRLTDVDHTTHEALVALETTRGEGVGLARYVQVPGERERAMFTVVVADTWQGRGAGTALGERLAARAQTAGIQRLTARTIVGDIPARRLAAHMGRILGDSRDDGVEELTVDLTTPSGG
jgi:RimJ/RimL family protein N-acetyltransferase